MKSALNWITANISITVDWYCGIYNEYDQLESKLFEILFIHHSFLDIVVFFLMFD